MSSLSARNLSFSFGEEQIVDDVDLELHPGEIHALVGLNGAGKTTLMRLLLDMLTADGGSVEIGGVPVESLNGTGWTSVGYLVETPFAYSELTVMENIRVAARLRGLPPEEVAPAVRRVIDRLRLGHWADRRQGTLSLGNRQRAGLASALVHEPSLLILDEPVNALDPAGVVLVRELLAELADAGAAILVSSHHLDEIARIAHRISVMHRGRIVGDIDPAAADLEKQFFDIAYRAERAMEPSQ